MKHKVPACYSHDKNVAPYVGAWIETIPCSGIFSNWTVAPYVGAWIETEGPVYISERTLVAPYVGAWIETTAQGSLP